MFPPQPGAHRSRIVSTFSYWRAAYGRSLRHLLRWNCKGDCQDAAAEVPPRHCALASASRLKSKLCVFLTTEGQNEDAAVVIEQSQLERMGFRVEPKLGPVHGRRPLATLLQATTFSAIAALGARCRSAIFCAGSALADRSARLCSFLAGRRRPWAIQAGEAGPRQAPGAYA
jgi:hypothetical protein